MSTATTTPETHDLPAWGFDTGEEPFSLHRLEQLDAHLASLAQMLADLNREIPDGDHNTPNSARSTAARIATFTQMVARRISYCVSPTDRELWGTHSTLTMIASALHGAIGLDAGMYPLGGFGECVRNCETVAVQARHRVRQAIARVEATR